MSAASYLDSFQTDDPGRAEPEETSERGAAPTPVVVRRNAGFAALVGAAASATSIAYLWRASESGAVLDWALCGVLAAIAVLYLVALLDARTPLLVADELGVRIRFGHQWRGLPWDAVETALVSPRRGPWRDGRLMFAPHSLGRALEGLDARGRRAAALNQKLYGAALVVPIGVGTRLSAHGQELADQLVTLSGGRTEVLVGRPERTRPEDRGADLEGPEDTPEPFEQAPEPVPATDEGDRTSEHPGRRRLAGGLATIVSRVAQGRSGDADSAPESEEPESDDPVTDDPETYDPAEEGPEPADRPRTPQPAAARWAIPLRHGRRSLRADVTRDAPAVVQGNAVLDNAVLGNAALAAPDLVDGLPRQRGHEGLELPEGDELHPIDELDPRDAAPALHEDDRVRPIARLGETLEPLVVDDFVTEPAYDPVIGPELAAARTRVGLSVDELAERTRIRPHVIESIEVDDFAPCGGDFYARGHLRTLARVLGRDPEPLLRQFDNRYATAPINARRVFEAELATGMTGSVRGSIGGPNWALLVGVVLVLVLVWGVVRLVATQPAEVLQPPAPVLNSDTGAVHGSGLGQARAAATPVRVRLTGSHAASRVVVRDHDGKVVWAGLLEPGAQRTVHATPPVSVRASNAGAVEASVAGGGKSQPIGALGRPGRRTLHAPSAATGH